jgi:hypothetical protein
MTCGTFLYNKEKNAKKINVENNNKLIDLLSSSATETKQPRMMMSRDLGLLSSFALEEKNQQMMTSQEACRHLRQLKKKMQKMVTT